VTLTELQRLLEAEMLCGKSSADLDIKVAKASDLMSDVLAYSGPGKLLLTGLTNNQVIRTCEIAGVSAIVFVRGKKPSAETIELATRCNICLLATKLSMFDSCGVLFSHGVMGVTKHET
jgi:predicted transcriptional regulator